MGNSYEPKVADLSTGVKAIWLLYQRGKWKELRQCGINRSCEKQLAEFDMKHLTPNVGGRIRTQEDVRKLIIFVPSVLDAAIYLCGRYQALTRNGEHT